MLQNLLADFNKRILKKKEERERKREEEKNDKVRKEGSIFTIVESKVMFIFSSTDDDHNLFRMFLKQFEFVGWKYTLIQWSTESEKFNEIVFCLILLA